LVAQTLLAKGRPVCSLIGKASSSVRSKSVGPSPFFRTATTPLPPTRVVTMKPARCHSSASRAAVFVS